MLAGGARGARGETGALPHFLVIEYSVPTLTSLRQFWKLGVPRHPQLGNSTSRYVPWRDPCPVFQEMSTRMCMTFTFEWSERMNCSFEIT